MTIATSTGTVGLADVIFQKKNLRPSTLTKIIIRGARRVLKCGRTTGGERIDLEGDDT